MTALKPRHTHQGCGQQDASVLSVGVASVHVPVQVKYNCVQPALVMAMGICILKGPSGYLSHADTC